MLRVLGLTLLSWLLAEGAAWAHDVGAECRLRDGRLEVQAYYDDNTAAADAKVRVEEKATGKVVAAGRTDKKGAWSCPAPAAGPYVLVVDAGAGHLARVPIPVPARGDALLGKTDAAVSHRPPEVISESPSRQEFTKLPIARIFLGLLILAFLGGGLCFWLSRRRAT